MHVENHGLADFLKPSIEAHGTGMRKDSHYSFSVEIEIRGSRLIIAC